MKQNHLLKIGFVIFLKGATFSDFVDCRLLNYIPSGIQICIPLFWGNFFQLGSCLIKQCHDNLLYELLLSQQLFCCIFSFRVLANEYYEKKEYLHIFNKIYSLNCLFYFSAFTSATEFPYCLYSLWHVLQITMN